MESKIIHVVGVQRTGQHAIISWLLGHFDKVAFKNHMSPSNREKWGFAPPFWYFEPKKRDEWEASEDFREGQDAWILGTELVGPPVQFNEHMATQMDAYGLSGTQEIIRIIRNPYNHYASVLNWRRNKLLVSPAKFKRAWMAMANAMIDKEQNPMELCYDIIFDKWFEEENYRKKITQLLNLKYSDRRLNTVMKIGVGKAWGSSFDGMTKKNKAQHMHVTERWKKMLDNEHFQQIYNDPEIELKANLIGMEKS